MARPRPLFIDQIPEKLLALRGPRKMKFVCFFVAT
jgi:hypothetical protein